MANTYKMRINSAECYAEKEGLQKVIYDVHFMYTVSDENGNSASLSSVQSLPFPDPSSFTPFDELVESKVISWVEQYINLDGLKANLDKMLEERVNPTKLRLVVAKDPDVKNETNITTEETDTEESTEETV